MNLFSEQDKENIRTVFRERLKSDVEVLVFTREHDCEYCSDVRELMEELSRIDERIRLKIYDLDKDAQVASKHEVDKAPAIIVSTGEDKGRIRFFGLPAGHEFGTLLEDLIDVSNGTSRLSPASRKKIRQIDRPVNIKVFVTVTCPYCPMVIRTAHQIALENKMVTADMIESTEFMQMALAYNVASVPKTIVNDQVEFVGALSEDQLVDKILSALRTFEAKEEKG
ncbi:MAG: protein disulfide oxidoreductase [Nitrososphaeria archaeon]